VHSLACEAFVFLLKIQPLGCAASKHLECRHKTLQRFQLQDDPTKRVTIQRYQLGSRESEGRARQTCDDIVAVEEPLEIRVVYGPTAKRRSKSLAITMRTPGHDDELATGFLLSENVIQSANQIQNIAHAGPAPENGTHGNTLIVDLDPSVDFSVERLQRHFYMTSSCGVCGKASIEAVMDQGFKPVPSRVQLNAETIASLPTELRTRQAVFDETGGLHAAGSFDSGGTLIVLREDVGRHNAVDKLVGQQLLGSSHTEQGREGHAPVGRVLVVSGRASFELVQKALTAKFEVLIAVGAPSSIAVQLAEGSR